jgi:transcriptional regulator with XRE-family HTH domain
MNLQKSVKVGFALKGGSQEELALFLKKSPATVSKYLNGKIDPPFSVVLTMCDYFKVPMNIFCRWSE